MRGSVVGILVVGVVDGGLAFEIEAVPPDGCRASDLAERVALPHFGRAGRYRISASDVTRAGNSHRSRRIARALHEHRDARAWTERRTAAARGRRSALRGARTSRARRGASQHPGASAAVLAAEMDHHPRRPRRHGARRVHRRQFRAAIHREREGPFRPGAPQDHRAGQRDDHAGHVDDGTSEPDRDPPFGRADGAGGRHPAPAGHARIQRRPPFGRAASPGAGGRFRDETRGPGEPSTFRSGAARGAGRDQRARSGPSAG